MIDVDQEENIDQSQCVRWSEADPLVKPERRAKGDIVFEVDCKPCAGSGKDHGEFCRPCMGRGRVADHRPVDEAISDIRYAQVQIRNILNFLWEKNIIEDQHHHDGQTFQIWRDMHRVALGQIRPVSSGGEEALGVRLRAYGFVLLLKRLNRYDMQAIERSLDTFANSHHEFFAIRDRQTYRRAFVRLSDILPPVKQHIASLEALSDAERNDLSEERLKKLVDGIVKHG